MTTIFSSKWDRCTHCGRYTGRGHVCECRIRQTMRDTISDSFIQRLTAKPVLNEAVEPDYAVVGAALVDCEVFA